MKTSKWLLRAQEYERTLSEDGVEAAEAYLGRYLSNVDRLLEAIGKYQELKRRRKANPSETIRTLKAVKKVRTLNQSEGELKLPDVRLLESS